MAQSQHLSITDLKIVLKELRLFPKERWQELGLKLGLYQPTLTTIRTDYKDDVRSCFRECMSAWLRKDDSVNDTTWDDLADVLEDIDRAISQSVRSTRLSVAATADVESFPDYLTNKYMKMNCNFGVLLRKVVTEITKQYCLDEIIDHLVSLEAGVLNELEQIKTNRQLIAYLRTFCYLSNIDFLRVNLVDHYDVCKEEIKDLTKERDEFYENIKAADFAQQAIKDHETSPHETEIMFTVSWSMKETTLMEFQKFLNVFFKKYKIHISLQSVHCSLLTFVCTIPHWIVDELTLFTEKNQHNLYFRGVVKVTINNYIIITRPIPLVKFEPHIILFVVIISAAMIIGVLLYGMNWTQLSLIVIGLLLAIIVSYVIYFFIRNATKIQNQLPTTPRSIDNVNSTNEIWQSQCIAEEETFSTSDISSYSTFAADDLKEPINQTMLLKEKEQALNADEDFTGPKEHKKPLEETEDKTPLEKSLPSENIHYEIINPNEQDQTLELKKELEVKNKMLRKMMQEIEHLQYQLKFTTDKQGEIAALQDKISLQSVQMIEKEEIIQSVKAELKESLDNNEEESRRLKEKNRIIKDLQYYIATKTQKHILDINNLDEVFDVLRRHHYAGTNSYELGLSLGLLKSTSDRIEKDHKGDTDHCLLECLKEWLKQVDNVIDKGSPTWYTFIKALHSIGENTVADGIDKEKHPACAILTKNYQSETIQDTLNSPSLLMLLYKEGLIKVDKLPNTSHTIIVTQVKDAVCKDYHNLGKFGDILCKFPSTASVGKAILNEYRQGFIYNNTDLHIPIHLITEFKQIREKFDSMFLEVSQAIHCISTPVKVQDAKKFLKHCNVFLKPQISKCKDIDDILVLIRENSSLIDISLLEALVDFFNSEEAKVIIQQHKGTVENFCISFPIRISLNLEITSQSTTNCYTFIVDQSVDDVTFKDIDILVRNALGGYTKNIQIVRR